MPTRPAASRRRRPAGVLSSLVAVLVLTVACGQDAPGSPTFTPPGTDGAAPDDTAVGGQLQPDQAQVIATGLSVPWDIAFLPDGDALVTERESRNVLRLPAGGGEPRVVAVLDQAEPQGEGGLLGLALSPDFEDDSLVYAYLTTAQENRIVRFALPEADGSPVEVEPVLTGIPAARTHNGGRIVFGPDGVLYAGTGDAQRPEQAQDDGSLAGKVLAMTREGEPVEGQDSLVFSKGHRNVQGLAFDAEGRLYAVEFGAGETDSVNQVSRGDNAGWPEVEGAGGDFLQPIVTWSPAEASPSGAVVADDALWVAALRGERLWQVPLDGQGGAGEPVAHLQGEFGRLRHVAEAPDGSLWVLTSNRDGRGSPDAEDDRILRIPVG